MRTHRQYLEERLRDERFAKEFRDEKQRLRIAYDIHTARIKSGLTQLDLAKRAGVTQQMVSRIETASKPNMAHSTVSKIAHALGMDIGLVQKRK